MTDPARCLELARVLQRRADDLRYVGQELVRNGDAAQWHCAKAVRFRESMRARRQDANTLAHHVRQLGVWLHAQALIAQAAPAGAADAAPAPAPAPMPLAAGRAAADAAQVGLQRHRLREFAQTRLSGFDVGLPVTGELVVINTDDLRLVAQRLGGALEQVGDVRLDLVRACGELPLDAAAYASWQQVIGALVGFGGVLAGDHQLLVTEVRGLEAEEGAPPASTTSPAALSRVVPDLATVRSLLNGREVPAPPPWRGQWVNAEGTMPPQTTRSAAAGFGTQWVERGSFDGGWIAGSGRSAGSASGVVYGEVTSGVDDRGNRHASVGGGLAAELSARVEGQLELGPLEVSGSAAAEAQARLTGEASGSIGPDGAHGQVAGLAEVSASSEAEVSVSLPGVGETSLGAQAEAAARAGGHAEGAIGPDGLATAGGVAAMTGASAGVGTSTSGPLGSDAGVGVDVRTGAGVEVGGGFTLGWDRIGGNVDLGVALGVGAGFSFDVSLSPKAIFGTLTDPIGAIEGLAGTAGDIAEWVGGAAGDVADAVSDFFAPPPPTDLLLDVVSGQQPAAPAPADLPPDLQAALLAVREPGGMVPQLGPELVVEQVQAAAGRFLW